VSFLEYLSNGTYQLLHGRVRLSTDVVHSPHFGIDGHIAEREPNSEQNQPQLQEKEK